MRAFLALLLLAAIGAAAFFWHRSDRMEERASLAESRAKRAENALAKVSNPGNFLTLDDVRILTRAGLTDPVSQLRSDLAGHSSLIPVKGVYGGKMGFYDRDGVVLLPGRYVYAPAEDGHILVHTLLRYDVKPGGKIEWKLVDAVQDPLTASSP
jgi:hypothetical protein